MCIGTHDALERPLDEVVRERLKAKPELTNPARRPPGPCGDVLHPDMRLVCLPQALVSERARDHGAPPHNVHMQHRPPPKTITGRDPHA